ncbi:NADH-quinone oxidoreductase subunit C [Henriciella mobilis]|uniref:NADH-quinone oxidoreductase subunit C n=1 Tax=Henriciella mobilis TaxID=2305467 RepID=A0A399RAV1_9PROT|nr:NADH-quinone oxidoreductase subunit C [Henriciella mobilis]RIJ15736.1 NADH-quinone oxidoreductase subunit C [Henriciella mobilis]RIJ19206.1 NADH-quinone oxidoreductase subunit C [Henriciella mobilis]RIJ28590.1 NADH-quinone oxidoreductase subunit C [Henriciella mobilis]
MTDALNDLGDHIRSSEAVADLVKRYEVKHGELTVYAERDGIVKLAKFLKDDNQCVFETLIDICGVDWPERSQRFDVVYHFLSMRLNQRIRIKIKTDEATPVPSLVDLHPSANWFEREAFDMYGIRFAGHPDMRRILTDYGFEGYPLRKDFPLTGFTQVRYDDLEKRVVNEPVELVQEYRNFDFLSPWEGMTKELPGDEKAGEEPSNG